MKKVLIISYFFPPMGGVSVQRITKFCKFLPEFGWQPIVLTVKNGYWTVWDHSNEDYKTGHEIIYRTPFYSPFTLLNKLSFGKANFGTTSEDKGKAIEHPSWQKRVMRNVSMLWCTPDEFISWLPFAYCHGLKVIKKLKADLIYANDSPHTCPLIGYVLSKKTGIPFIVDFRDLWTGNPEFNPRNKVEQKLQEKIESTVVHNANKITTVTNGFAQSLGNDWGEKISSKIEVIYNGFDLDDYKNSQAREIEKRYNKFRIVYTGSFFGTFMNPDMFLYAFKKLIDKHKLSPDKVEIYFIGSNSMVLKQKILQLKLNNFITLIDHSPHDDTCTFQKSADLLVLIVYSVKGGESRVPGKLFEYMAAGSPILAIAPQGEVSKIINKTGTGIIAKPDNVDDIERCLSLLYEKIQIKKERFQRNDIEINKFSRRDQTRRLAEIFNTVIENQG